MKEWWGPAVLGHPWWKDAKFHSAFKFEAATETAAIEQATEAYRLALPRAVVEIAKTQDEVHASLDDFLAKKSDVLKICPIE